MLIRKWKQINLIESYRGDYTILAIRIGEIKYTKNLGSYNRKFSKYKSNYVVVVSKFSLLTPLLMRSVLCLRISIRLTVKSLVWFQSLWVFAFTSVLVFLQYSWKIERNGGSKTMEATIILYWTSTSISYSTFSTIMIVRIKEKYWIISFFWSFFFSTFSTICKQTSFKSSGINMTYNLPWIGRFFL